MGSRSNGWLRGGSQLLLAPIQPQQRSGLHLARGRHVRGDVLVDARRDFFGIAR